MKRACSVQAEAFGIAVFKVRSRQKIRADHLQHVASGFVASQHQSRCFKGLLDDRQLALVQLEVDQSPTVLFLSPSGVVPPPA